MDVETNLLLNFTQLQNLTAIPDSAASASLVLTLLVYFVVDILLVASMTDQQEICLHIYHII